MYLTFMVDVGRAAEPSHGMLELVAILDYLDLATLCSVHLTCAFVSEKTLSKMKKHICNSAQREFHFSCSSSHQGGIVGILGSGMV